MEHSKQPFLKRLLSVRGMGAALTAFAGLIIIYIAFGLINPTVFSGRNIVNLTRSMSKYLIIGIGQSYLLITGEDENYEDFRARMLASSPRAAWNSWILTSAFARWTAGWRPWRAACC